jgi:hypothetical protein
MTVSTPGSLPGPCSRQNRRGQGSACTLLGHAYRLEATIGIEVVLTIAQPEGSQSAGSISMKDNWMKRAMFLRSMFLKLTAPGPV